LVSKSLRPALPKSLGLHTMQTDSLCIYFIPMPKPLLNTAPKTRKSAVQAHCLSACFDGLFFQASLSLHQKQSGFQKPRELIVRVHSFLFFGQYIYSRIPTCFRVLVIIIYNRVIFFLNIKKFSCEIQDLKKIKELVY